MPTTITVAKHEGIATLTFESSDGLHVLSRATMEALRDALEAVSRDVAVQALVLTGAGQRVFSAGADLRELLELDGERAVAYSEFGQGVAQAIARYPVPTFAALNGPVYGGGIELSLACDFRIAVPECLFHYQAAKLGLLPGWGGTQRLPLLIGRSRAKSMMLMCRPVSADEALDWGLVDDLSHGMDLTDCVAGWTEKLTAMDRQSAIQIKRAIDLGHHGDFIGEREAFAACFAGERTQRRIRDWLARAKDGRTAAGLPSSSGHPSSLDAAQAAVSVPGASGTA